jgi:radical SAM superfamily enzyme YgiQ (UPF0313 family)
MIIDFDPVCVMASIVEDNYQYATSLFAAIKNSFPDLPIIVGGTTPTVATDVMRENPLIDFVFSGEAESLTGFFFGGVFSKNKFTDLNTIPVQNLFLWDQRHFIKPYDGKLYRSGFVEMSRGCMNHCSYCVNAMYKEMFKDYGKYFREKSIDKVIEETKRVHSDLAK